MRVCERRVDVNFEECFIFKQREKGIGKSSCVSGNNGVVGVGWQAEQFSSAANRRIGRVLRVLWKSHTLVNSLSLCSEALVTLQVRGKVLCRSVS